MLTFYSFFPLVCISGFDELLTPAEKAKLYTAIGYSETAANPNLPKNVSHFSFINRLSTDNTLLFCSSWNSVICGQKSSFVFCLQFEDMKVKFHMERLTVSIKDKKDKNEIIKLTVEELKSTLAQRPGAQAIKSVTTLFEQLLANFSVVWFLLNIWDIFELINLETCMWFKRF